MRLGVSSICSHIFWEGMWWSYEPYVQEMDVWLDIFESMVVVAPLENGPPPEFWSPYRNSERLSVIPYQKNKGWGLNQKKTSIRDIPMMVSALVKGITSTDAFHLRTPGNISLLGLFLAPLLQKRVCAKYAGQWPSYPGEALSYRVQKALLRSFWFHGPVTVYGQWMIQPNHIIPFFTSVMNTEQVRMATKVAACRVLHNPIRVLFVGRLTKSKNVHILLDALSQLEKEKVSFECRIIGDGPEKQALEVQAKQQLVDSYNISFTGGLPFEEVLSNYEWADVLILVSETEGWPKAIAEGMTYGLVCIGNNRGLVPQMLEQERGWVVEPGNSEALVNIIKRITQYPDQYCEISKRAALWAKKYSLDSLRDAIRELLIQEWKLPTSSLRPSVKKINK